MKILYLAPYVLVGLTVLALIVSNDIRQDRKRQRSRALRAARRASAAIAVDNPRY
jgi:hypothetical protein